MDGLLGSYTTSGERDYRYCLVCMVLQQESRNVFAYRTSFATNDWAFIPLQVYIGVIQTTRTEQNNIHLARLRSPLHKYLTRLLRTFHSFDHLQPCQQHLNARHYILWCRITRDSLFLVAEENWLLIIR